MIHLADTSLDLTTVMCSVRFPVQAGRAPLRAPIVLTDECIPGVEVLQARRWSRSRRRCGYLTRITMAGDGSVPSAFPASILPSASIRTSATSFPIVLVVLSLRLVLMQSAPLAAAWHVSGIDNYGIKEPSVGENEEVEQDGVYHEDGNRWARARSVERGGRPKEVVHCWCLSAWINGMGLGSPTA